MESIYRSFLLRLWQAGASGEPAWRISLEDTRTRQVTGFEDLESLHEYLRLLFAAPERPAGAPEKD